MTTQSQVLVVEDREDWQDIVCDAVREAGHQPHAVADYEAALRLLQAQRFDLAIVDPVLDMSNRFNRDGLSIIQQISDSQPGIPVMILTGSLTQDLKKSLQYLNPNAPVLYKESWKRDEFTSLLQEMTADTAADGTSRAADADPAYAYVAQQLLAPDRQRALNAPRVLLVENREDWQNIVAGVLEEIGCFWRIAPTAEAALREMERENFHLVILDLKLQANDLPLTSNEGWLLLDFLTESRPKTKVMVLSGRAGPSDVAYLLTNYPIISFVEKQQFSSDDIRAAVTKATEAPALHIQTFGQFRLWRNNEVIDVWDRPQAETLVKFLLVRRVRGMQVVSADELIERLWPEASLEDGRKQLQPLISNARRTLEPDIEPRDSNFILRGANGYFFDLGSNVSWDLIEFWDYLEQGRQLVLAEAWDAAVTVLEKGKACYRGDFLVEDRYADWVIAIQRELSRNFRDLLIDLADSYTALEQYGPAIDACELALRKDPLLESVYRRLMRLHYCQGEKGQALKVYRDCIKLFEELFGESPTPATRQLKDAIAADEPIDCLSRT